MFKHRVLVCLFAIAFLATGGLVGTFQAGGAWHSTPDSALLDAVGGVDAACCYTECVEKKVCDWDKSHDFNCETQNGCFKSPDGREVRKICRNGGKDGTNNGTVPNGYWDTKAQYCEKCVADTVGKLACKLDKQFVRCDEKRDCNPYCEKEGGAWKCKQISAKVINRKDRRMPSGKDCKVNIPL